MMWWNCGANALFLHMQVPGAPKGHKVLNVWLLTLNKLIRGLTPSAHNSIVYVDGTQSCIEVVCFEVYMWSIDQQGPCHAVNSLDCPFGLVVGLCVWRQRVIEALELLEFFLGVETIGCIVIVGAQKTVIFVQK